MKSNKTVFVFDFDGVIVDTIQSLFDIYIDFLQGFGVVGTKGEFDYLNGPKLTEIIDYLKKKHSIEGDLVQLERLYREKLRSLYDSAVLNKDVGSIFSLLETNNNPIAIASSCKRDEIESVLKRYDLDKFVDTIVSGDDVKQAKPSPEIYNRVKELYKNHHCIVIEDSPNGLLSARLAGLTTVEYNPGKAGVDGKADYTIQSLSSLKTIMTECKLNCYTVAQATDISLKLVGGEWQPPQQNDLINTLWEKGKKEGPLFNGWIVVYQSHSLIGNTLVIECLRCQYKYYYAQTCSEKVDYQLYPMGVSGIIIDRENNTLVGKRCNVTDLEGSYELMPSGSIEPAEITGGLVKFTDQIVIELEEETPLIKTDIEELIPFCLIFGKTNRVYDICVQIILNASLTNLRCPQTTNEYSDIQVVNLAEIENWLRMKRVVPSTWVLLNNYLMTGK